MDGHIPTELPPHYRLTFSLREGDASFFPASVPNFPKFIGPVKMAIRSVTVTTMSSTVTTKIGQIYRLSVTGRIRYALNSSPLIPRSEFIQIESQPFFMECGCSHRERIPRHKLQLDPVNQ